MAHLHTPSAATHPTNKQLPPVVAASILALLLLAFGVQVFSIAVDNAPETYFPRNAEAVLADDEVRQFFPNDQVLIGMFAGHKDLYTDTFIAALGQVVSKLTTNERVERTLAVTTIDHIRGSEAAFLVEPLLDEATATELALSERIARVLSDRFAPGLIVSGDGSFMALIVRPNRLQNSYERLQLVEDFRAAVSDAGIYQQLVALSGSVALDAAELRSMIRDTLLFIPVTSVMGLLFIWWIYRRILAVVLSAVAMATVSLGTVSILILADQPYTLISAMIPPLMAALTTALLVHIFNALVYAQERGQQGRLLVSYALTAVRRPAFYTVITTAAGLASLGVSPIRPITAFGLGCAGGMLLLYFVGIFLLPPILSGWDQGTWKTEGRSVRNISRLVRSLTRFGIRYAGWVVLGVSLAIGLGLPQLWRITVESDVYEFFPEDHPLTLSTRLIESRLSGVTALQVMFRGPSRDSLKDPARLRIIDQFQEWLHEQPEVDRTLSMVDLIEEMNWAFHAEKPSYRRLPESSAVISQYLFIYDGTDLHDLVNREFDRTLVAMNLNIHGANATTAVMERIRSYLQEAETLDLRWQIAGFGRLLADQEDLLITGQVHSLVMALGMIFLFMLVLWRSFGAALLCMIPNVSPILVIFMLMGAAGLWLDFATAMVASVAVGIAVDDTIHAYYGYRRRRSLGASSTFALMRSYNHAGRALTVTTMVLGAQFLLLTTSSFIPTAEFGLLTATGLVTALLFDLLLLPALLTLAAHGARRHGSRP